MADVARGALKEKGYLILSALNAEEAVRVAEAHADPIHLLLTEFVMPGTSGQDLARQLRVQRPEIKVLCIVAFTLLVKGQQHYSDAVSDSEPGAPIILKPFTSARLAEKVQDVLAPKPISSVDQLPDLWRNI